MEPYGDDVIIGPGHHIEANCLLGYLPGRPLADLTLRLGRDCHLRTGTILYAGSTIGDGLQTGHNVIIREENLIGDHLSIWANSVIDYQCRIGCRVRIHCNCYICQYTTIEDEVFLGPGVTLANDVYPLQDDAVPYMEGPTVKRGAKIGVNATILPRVIIGEGAWVGAGSVVTHNVEPGAVVAGNPARVINRVDRVRPIEARVAFEKGDA